MNAQNSCRANRPAVHARAGISLSSALHVIDHAHVHQQRVVMKLSETHRGSKEAPKAGGEHEPE